MTTHQSVSQSGPSVDTGEGEYIWGVEQYATRQQVEEAIASHCADELTDRDAGYVQLPDGSQCRIRITATLEPLD
jgi:hypothetical protein